MILSVSLNPCLDKIVKVETLVPHTLNRGLEVLVSPGGKGVNVAKVVATMEEKACVLGFFAGGAGRFIVDAIGGLGVSTYPVWLKKQETRTTTNILEKASGKETEITEPGPLIPKESQDAFMETFKKLLPECDVVVLSGSAPLGVQDDVYERLIALAKGKTCILDTGGALLRKGIKSAPRIIKPNIRELEALTGKNLRSRAQLEVVCNDLHQQGVEFVCVSLGAEGAYLSTAAHRYDQPAFSVDVVNTIGSGDAMVAGLAIAMKRGYDPCAMLRFASACAASNAGRKEIGMVDKAQVYDLFYETGGV